MILLIITKLDYPSLQKLSNDYPYRYKMPHIRTNITHVHRASQTYLPSLINQQPSTNLQRNELKLPNSFCTFTKALSQILAFLETQALTDKNLDVALIAQIKGFEKIGLLEENDDTDYIGFLPTENNNGIFCSNVGIIDHINIEELRAAIDLIDKLAVMAYKDRLELLSHILLFGLIAPCSFIFKCIKAPCLEWTSFYDSPNSTKTSSSKIVLALDGHENDQDYNVNMQHVRSSLVNSRLHNNFLEHSCLV